MSERLWYKDKDWEQLYEEYQSGKSLRQLERELNISHKTIARHFRDMNKEIREAKYHFKKVVINGKKDWLYRHLYCAYYNLLEIPKGHVVHHKDFDRNNNSEENLQLLSETEHNLIHIQMRDRDNLGRFSQMKKIIKEEPEEE